VRLRYGAVALLVSVTGFEGCNGGEPDSTEVKDSEVRRYIRDELEPYLDSLSHQLCRIHEALPKPEEVGPGNDMCPPDPDGYKKPPSNGAP